MISDPQPPFKVGNLVTTDYNRSDSALIRRVTRVERVPGYESGWAVSADGGEPCPHCRRSFAEGIDMVDANWFKLVRDSGDSAA